MAMLLAGGGARGPQINITPLIDVLLTLIIVFMVGVSMDKEQGETAQIPQPNQKQTANIAEPRTVVIQVVWTKADDQAQPGRSAPGGPRDAAGGDLLKASGKSSLRAWG